MNSLYYHNSNIKLQIMRSTTRLHEMISIKEDEWKSTRADKI
jgi:hypothetical protein